MQPEFAQTMPDAGETTDLAVLERLMRNRYSCRAYQAKPVDAACIRSMVTLAGRSASWCNVQPWQLVITETPENTERFRQALTAHVATRPPVTSDLALPPGYEGVYAERRRETGYALYNALGIARDDRVRRDAQAFENFRFFGAPHVAIVTVPAQLGPYAVVDVGGFIAAFLLAAQAYGVATTAQAAIAFHARFVRDYFNIPDTQHMVCAISFGYAQEEHPANMFRTTRADVQDVVQFA